MLHVKHKVDHFDFLVACMRWNKDFKSIYICVTGAVP